MTDSNTSRTIATAGIHNFRDSGGYRAAGGRQLARGLLYRSGEHTAATDADLRIVDGLGFAAIVDLRGTSERLAGPSRRPPVFAVPVYVVDGETALDTRHDGPAPRRIDAEAARHGMLQRYRTMPFRPLLVAAFRLYLQTLACSAGPVLVSCTAGKDRTGLAVALVHSALGVHYDDILFDYLLTNSTGDRDARLAALKPDLERRYRAAMDEEAVRVAGSAQEEYLNASWTSIREQYGSIDAYLNQVLGVTPAICAALASRPPAGLSIRCFPRSRDRRRRSTSCFRKRFRAQPVENHEVHIAARQDKLIRLYAPAHATAQTVMLPCPIS